MPFAGFKNFQACVSFQVKNGKSGDSANKICGALQSRLEKSNEKVIHIQRLGDFNDKKDFELITTAKQTDNRYGNFRYTKADLQEMADNFNNNIVGVDIAVDLNHDREGIALAWIKPKSMSVKPSSKLDGHFSLYAKLHNFTPEGLKLVKTGAIKYFSIEIQHKFEKFVNEVKKTFKNVIRGLALTNRPVIKDMMPTFSEENIIIKNKSIMNAFKIFLSQLKEQKFVSLTEKETLNKMFAELEEDEKAEIKDEKEEVDKKPGEEKKVEEKTDEEKKAEEDAKKAKEKEDEDKDLSEVKEELKETKATADRALTELRKRDMSENADTMILTDSKKELSFGIVKSSKDKLVNFLMSLSDKQIADFKEIWTEIKAVDFSEKGLDGEGNIEVKTEKFDGADEPVSEESAKIDAEIKTLMQKDKDLSYEEAFNKVASK